MIDFLLPFLNHFRSNTSKFTSIERIKNANSDRSFELYTLYFQLLAIRLYQTTVCHTVWTRKPDVMTWPLGRKFFHNRL